MYSELAAMFPATAGGISLYAHEGWRERSRLAGPVGAFGYWFGWSGALAVYGVIIGELVRARWAPGADPDLIAAGAVLAVWVPNVLGITRRCAWPTRRRRCCWCRSRCCSRGRGSAATGARTI